LQFALNVGWWRTPLLPLPRDDQNSARTPIDGSTIWKLSSLGMPPACVMP
jgi:hypothetical protein